MKTPKKNKKNTPKMLKYNPAKDKNQGLWKIQAIINDRVSLKPKVIKNNQQDEPKENQIVIDYDTQKQYEIAWQQNCAAGLWPDTWQPQENIPDFTRLDYLLRKRSELRTIKKKTREQRKKAKQSFKQHQQFTMNNMKRKSQNNNTSILQTRQTVKKILSKDSLAGSEKKVQKKKDYRDWHISYQQNEMFKTILKRLQKGEKNSKIQQQRIIQARIKSQPIDRREKDNSRVKCDDVKKQTNFNTKTQQRAHLKTNNNKGNNKIQQKEQQLHYQNQINVTAFPQRSTEMFIKNIKYIGSESEVDYFSVELMDGSVSYISQQDLVKYFPFAYKNYLQQQINSSIQQAIGTLKGKMFQQGYRQRECMKKLGVEIGIRREDFQLTLKQGSLFGPKREISRYNIFLDTYGGVNRLLFSSQDQQQKNGQEVQFKKRGKQSNDKESIKKEIDNYFSFLSNSHDNNISSQVIAIPYLNVGDQRSFEKNSQQINVLIPFSTRCEKLFKIQQVKNNNEILKGKSDKKKVQFQKVSIGRLQKNSLSNSKRENTNKNVLFNEPQTPLSKQELFHLQRKNQPTKTFSIKQLEIKKQQINYQDKKQITNNKNNNNDKQIQQILNVLDKKSLKLVQHDFYDSDDQSIK